MGEGYELVLHSLDDENKSILKIINGGLSSRKEGDPITNLTLSLMHQIENNEAEDYMVYFNRNKFGEPIKAATLAIRGSKNRIIGLLCINFYLNTPFTRVMGAFILEHNSMQQAPVIDTISENTDDMIIKAFQRTPSISTSEISGMSPLKSHTPCGNKLQESREQPMISTYALLINPDFCQTTYHRLLRLIPNKKKERIEHYHFFADSLRSLSAELLLREKLSTVLNLPFIELEFNQNSYSKPFLRNYPHIHFNVSHSGCWVAAAIHTMPVGVDVETIRQTDHQIAERFFSKEEVQWLNSRTAEEKEKAFCWLWTRKESFVKAVGKGLYIPLNSFSVLSDRITIYPNAVKGAVDLTEADYYLHQYSIDPEYQMALCSQSEEFPDKVEIMELNEFSHYLLMKYW